MLVLHLLFRVMDGLRSVRTEPRQYFLINEVFRQPHDTVETFGMVTKAEKAD